jgi:chromosome segregation ATPase
MNKFYIIVPIVVLAAFIAYYSQFTKQQAVIEQKELQAKIDDDNAKKEQAEAATAKAIADAHARKEAQDAEDARQEAEHLAKYEASKQKLADETAKFQQEADGYAKQAADLQAQLDSLQASHDKASRELFDLQKQVELEKIDRRDADLEIQRTYDMVTQKVAASSLTYVPPPPAAEVK